MNKKNWVILIVAVLLVVAVAAVVIGLSLNKDKPDNQETTVTTGETVEPAIEQPTITVEDTEPAFGGSDLEIDFDDLIGAANG